MTSRDLAGPVLNQESPEPEGQTSGHQVVTGRDRVEERGHAEQDHSDEEQRKDHGIIIPTSPADEPTEEDAVFIRHLAGVPMTKVPELPLKVIEAARTVDGGKCMGAVAVAWIEGFRTAQWTVAEEIAGAIEEWAAGLGSPQDWEEAINAAKDCARIAREHAQPEPPTDQFRKTAETLNVDQHRHYALSSACHHEQAGDTQYSAEYLHSYCESRNGRLGPKSPQRCKWCPARCGCPNHRPLTEEDL